LLLSHMPLPVTCLRALSLSLVPRRHRYGAQAWLQQNAALATMHASVAARAAAAAKAAEGANLKRKVEQEKGAPRLAQLGQAYAKSLDENQQLATAIALLGSDVKRLRGEAEARGLVQTEAAEAAAAAAALEKATKGRGLGGGTTAEDVDLFAGGEVTGMAD